MSGAEYHCGFCGYEGPCYGVPIFWKGECIPSTPWCYHCGLNDRLTPLAEYQAQKKTPDRKAGGKFGRKRP